MQTAAIAYRVADFLKRYPPFQSIEEADLLTLVSTGRVKFYESDEFLCWQNAGYSSFFLVIQQGSVSLWEEANGKETLRDVRGPGDMIGAERFVGAEKSPYSARANGDVVVYALRAADFEIPLERYPHARRFVDACAAVGAVYRHSSREGVHEKFVGELTLSRESATCDLHQTVQECARRIRDFGNGPIAVMEQGLLRGVIGPAEIVAWAAGGSVGATAGDIVRAASCTVAPQQHVSDCVLSMSRVNSDYAAMTSDGTSKGAFLRLITAEDLQQAFGENPVTLLREIALAPDKEALRQLHLRATSLMLVHLPDPSAVDWIASFRESLNLAILRRLNQLAGRGTTAGWSFCFWGAAGRGELIAPAEPGIALICRDACDVSSGLEALLQLRADLAECGYVPYDLPEWKNLPLCATAADWAERFSGWIHQPVLTGMHRARALFDLRFAFGGRELWRDLEQSVMTEIRAEPSFGMLLASDSFSALPPLTFFEDEVVEESGDRTGLFALEQNALGPVVEVGRAFGVAGERVFGSSTLDRLAGARARMPGQENLFREAKETLRVLLYLQGRTGLRQRNSGAVILP